jgi:DNA polymerase III delta prime subunit
MSEEFLLTEKYRPRTIDECILPEELRKTFKGFVKNGIPNLILSGTPGIGKTTVARALLEEAGHDYILINGSMRGNIDTLRTDIQDYASTSSFSGGRKYVILDEADYLNPQSTQPALRGFMEQFSKNCGFILTCNSVNKILGALQSRTSVIDFHIPKTETAKLAGVFFERIKYILKQEEITAYDDKVIKQLLILKFPDWRSVINEIQRYSINGKIDSGILLGSDSSNIKQIYDLCKAKDFDKIRQWAAGAVSASNPETLYAEIGKVFPKYMEKKFVPNLIVLLGEYQYKAAFVANQDINMAAFLTEVMGNCFPS